MKKNKERKQLSKKNKVNMNYGWILKVTFLAFLISFTFSFFSENVLPQVNTFVGISLVIIFIVLGVLFDMVGVAVTSAEEAPFHSMASRKVRGGLVAVRLKKSADKVSSFCNDVIGDICGIVSGSAGVIIASNLSQTLKTSPFFTTLFLTAFIAALTIGGKAVGKAFAINKSNVILYTFSRLLSYVYHPKNKG